jgi:succinyl-diaminopimelate desuccinylase
MNAIDNKLLLSLSRQLISFQTFDPPGNELPAAELISSVLADHGIESELQSIGENRASVIARIKGKGTKPGLIFSAHIDTIPVNASEWSVDPFGGIVKDGRLYGRGATDMKAALASMLVAAIAVKDEKLEGDLILAFSAAENSNCLGARTMVESGILEGAGALLVSEPTSLDVFIAEKGALWLQATAIGEYGHIAFSADRTGDIGSANLRMADFLCRVRDLKLDAVPHPLLGMPAVNVGMVHGGISFPLIAPECKAFIDIRTIPGMVPENVLAQFRAIAGPHVKIEILDNKPPVATPEDHPFVTLCVDSVRQQRAEEPAVTGVSYISDAAFISPGLDVPMVIIGPGELGKSGSIDEYCEIDKLEASARIFADIALKYLK